MTVSYKGKYLDRARQIDPGAVQVEERPGGGVVLLIDEGKVDAVLALFPGSYVEDAQRKPDYLEANR